MTQKKKKKAATRELLIGSGVLALFSPLILLGLIGAGIALALLVTVMLAGIDIPSLGLALLVYGILFSVMLFLIAKFSARFRLLIGRLIGIFRERRRYQNAVDSPSADTYIDEDDDVLRHYAADQHVTSEADYR